MQTYGCADSCIASRRIGRVWKCLLTLCDAWRPAGHARKLRRRRNRRPIELLGCAFVHALLHKAMLMLRICSSRCYYYSPVVDIDLAAIVATEDVARRNCRKREAKDRRLGSPACVVESIYASPVISCTHHGQAQVGNIYTGKEDSYC